ncbi:MAG: glycosyltransferase family 4 protein, partial [Candidatus Heimdallarchaeaceae archaeon]
MKILFFTARVPYPPNRGDRIRPFYFIKHLSKKHNITVLSFAETEEERLNAEGLKEFCKSVEIVPLSRSKAYINCLIRLFSPMPLQCSFYISQNMRKKIKELLKYEKIDLVYVFPLRLAHYRNLFGNIPIVLGYCDSKALLHGRSLLKRRNPISWFIDFEEWIKIRNYEIKVGKDFERCLTISPVDKRCLERKGRLDNLLVIPNGVDLEYFKSVDRKSEPNSLIFTGSMDVFWNIDAVVFFCKKVFPSIKKEIKNVKLYIVGSNPSRKIKKLGKNPQIVVTGKVPDIRPFLAKSTISIVPIRVGAGIKNKVLESMAMKKPVISTSIGCEGIEVTPGKNVIIADDPKRFTHEVIQLLKDEYLRNSIALAGYELV